MINQANHIKSPVSALIAYAKKQHEDEILCNLVPKKLKKYHEESLIHIHDLEYFDLTIIVLAFQLKIWYTEQ